jgi:hypothetical protein
VAAHGFHAVRQFGGVALEELAPRRRVEEQLAHVHRGAGDARRRAGLAGARVQPGGVWRAAVRLVIDSSATDAMAASASPRKPIVATMLEVVERGDLAGGVALQRQRQFVASSMPHAAVVLDWDGVLRTHPPGRRPAGALIS